MPKQNIFSSELKKKAGFGKGGEKGFDGVITALPDADLSFVSEIFASEKTKGEAYGWPVAALLYAGASLGTGSCDKRLCRISGFLRRKIAAHMREIYPIATRQQVHRLVGNIVAL